MKSRPEMNSLVTRTHRMISRRSIGRSPSVTHLRCGSLRFVQLFALLSCLCGVTHAQGGPPFKTDDPETPGNRHWEINFGWTGERSAGEGSYSIPDVDLNYGLGDRIQLKFELPIVIHEVRQLPGYSGQIASATQARLDLGAGESLLGIKWRFYQHQPAPTRRATADREPAEPNFSISTYPQLSLNNPTSSVERGVVTNGPQFLLPLEANARIGPIRIDGEVGYWFTNRDVPQSWIRGMIIGYEFTKRTEAYVEIYDQQDATRVDGAAKGRQATLGLGGRHAVDRKHNVSLLLMGGRSFQKVTPDNVQPGWIAYVGVQFLLGPRESNHLRE
jgi:hypothetical protein